MSRFKESIGIVDIINRVKELAARKRKTWTRNISALKLINMIIQEGYVRPDKIRLLLLTIEYKLKYGKREHGRALYDLV